MKLRLFALCLVSGAVGACQAETSADRCGADTLHGLVGTLASELDGSALPEGTRVIGPTTAVTMDFLPARLNIDVGEDGRITRFWCG